MSDRYYSIAILLDKLLVSRGAFFRLIASQEIVQSVVVYVVVFSFLEPFLRASILCD
jgi:hypothetical protein